MSRYLLIESRDPFELRDDGYLADLAAQLAAARHEVTLFLIQNGVLAARSGVQGTPFSQLAAAGVQVLADDFSLRERGIVAARLHPSVRSSPIDVVIDELTKGSKTLWH